MTSCKSNQDTRSAIIKKISLLLVTAALIISGPGTAQEPDYTKHPRYAEFAAQYQAYDRAAASRDFRAALDPARKSLELAREIFGDDAAMTGVMYDRLAYAESATGSFDLAIEHYQKAAAIYAARYGAASEYLGTAYLNMGEAYRSKGDVSRALEFHSAAMDIYRKKLGDKHVYVATACNYIGGALKSRGDYRGAISHYEKALAIYRESLGEDHEFVATTYVNLGGSHEPLGEYDRAVEYYLKAVPIYKKTIGEDHPFLAVAYNNLGLGYHYLGDESSSITYYNLALSIYLKTLGADHPHTAYACINLGQAYRALKSYDDSEKYYMRALGILTGGGDRDGRITALTHLGELYVEREQPKKASESFGAAAALVLKYRLEIGRGKSGFSDRHIGVFNRIIDLELARGDTEKAFIADCMKKGLSITEDMTLKDALGKGEVPAEKQARLLTIMNEIETAESDRAVQAESGNPAEAGKLMKAIWKLEAEKEKTDAALMASYPAYAALRSPAAPALADILAALAPDQALVSYSLNEKKCTAFVLTQDRGLRAVDLGGDIYGEIANDSRNIHVLYKYPSGGTILARIRSADGSPVFWNRKLEGKKYSVRDGSVYSLDSAGLVTGDFPRAGDAGFREILVGAIEGDIDANGIEQERERLSRKLFDGLLKPVMNEAPSARKFVIVPDGPVYYVPIGILKDESGGMFSQSRQYCLVHSPAIWLDLAGRKSARAAHPLLALGNAVYGAGHENVGAAVRGRMRSAGSMAFHGEAAAAEGSFQAEASDDPGFGNLPGTAEEVALIGNIAYGGESPAGHVLTGIDANEDMVFEMNDRKILGKYRIIHFAAHGLFIDSNPSLNAIVLSLPAAAKKHRKVEYGAYTTRHGGMRRDGYLRLGEIKTLGLKCDLVVMSACETSLGHYIRGEGMVGLPQAFMIAGSRSVMASLWPVDDEAACLLMEEFYGNILKKGMPPGRALQEAQRSVSEEFPDPFYWAPFVVYGE